MTATWYKLKTGEWGVKVRHDGQPGEKVEVTNKKGETKVVWLDARAAKFDDHSCASSNLAARASSHTTLVSPFLLVTSIFSPGWPSWRTLTPHSPVFSLYHVAVICNHLPGSIEP